MTLPPPLRARSKLRVVAPSSPFDRRLVLRGMGFLAGRYRVAYEQRLFEGAGFLAGSDERRLDELNRALRDPDTRAIVAARGGYGLGRIAHLVDTAALRADPKWLVGFSDVTALHVEAQAAGVMSLHATNVGGLAAGSARIRQRFIDALEHPERPRHYEQLERWQGGVARGPLLGGNLTVLSFAALSGRWRPPPGAVLALEDVTELPYRIDRTLTALLQSGLLQQLGAVLIGDFTDCGPGRHGVSAQTVLRERLGGLGVPILSGLHFGHGPQNEPLTLGALATVDADARSLTIEPSPV